MTDDYVPAPPDPSHDDLSNPGPIRNNEGIPEFANGSHDRNDDGPDRPASTPSESRPAEDKITG